MKTKPIKIYLLLVILLSSQGLVLGVSKMDPHPVTPISKPPYSSHHLKLMGSWIKDGRITLPSLQRINTENFIKFMRRLDQKQSPLPPVSIEPHPDAELRDELIMNLRRIEQKVINGELPKEALEAIKKILETGAKGENLPDLAKLMGDQAALAEDLYSFGSDSSDSSSTVPDFNTYA